MYIDFVYVQWYMHRINCMHWNKNVGVYADMDHLTSGGGEVFCISKYV